MNILRSIGFVAVMGLVGLGGIEIVGRTAVPGFQGVIATAHAVVGRPLTPVSVAGAGIECTYRASLSDSYTGMMECPGRAAVPLELWVK